MTPDQFQQLLQEVHVRWTIKVDGYGYDPDMRSSNWRKDWLNCRVVERRTFRDGKDYFILDGHPHCPVRVERCEPVRK